MAEIWLIRHAQASFGAADYDKLSDLGHEQSRALGRALRRLGFQPDASFIGAQRRHRETFQGIAEGLDCPAPTLHPGLNEFDFTGLLNARFPEGGPEDMHTDRRSHFRTLRDTVLAWQADEIEAPPESFAAFQQRVQDARHAMLESGAERILVVSSGGAIGETCRAAMDAPAAQMIRFQLQTRNCGLSRFILTDRAFHLATFNETPHIEADTSDLLTYP